MLRASSTFPVSAPPAQAGEMATTPLWPARFGFAPCRESRQGECLLSGWLEEQKMQPVNPAEPGGCSARVCVRAWRGAGGLRHTEQAPPGRRELMEPPKQRVSSTPALVPSSFGIHPSPHSEAGATRQGGFGGGET